MCDKFGICQEEAVLLSCVLEKSHGYSDEEYASLGRKYSFSGGQIENVVRKSAVDYILTGNRTDLETVYKFCDEEIFKSKVKKVGF